MGSLWESLSSNILAKDKVVDQWGTLIPGAQGLDESIVSNTEQFIKDTNAPDIQMERQALSPGLLRSVMGDKRYFLVISNTGNRNLKTYKMLVNARDYGNSLQVSWYLVHEPSDLEKAILMLLLIPCIGLVVLPIYLIMRLAGAGKSGLLGLDMFDEQDLRAYVSNAHHCMLQAVDQLGKENNIDVTNINRRSTGFLGIT